MRERGKTEKNSKTVSESRREKALSQHFLLGSCTSRGGGGRKKNNAPPTKTKQKSPVSSVLKHKYRQLCQPASLNPTQLNRRGRRQGTCEKADGTLTAGGERKTLPPQKSEGLQRNLPLVAHYKATRHVRESQVGGEKRSRPKLS